MTDALAAVLALLGVALVVVGAALVSVPLAFVVSGVLALTVARLLLASATAATTPGSDS